MTVNDGSRKSLFKKMFFSVKPLSLLIIINIFYKDCVGSEDLLKSLSQLGKDEKEESCDLQRDQKIIHQPIDWSNYPPETFADGSQTSE